MGSSADAKIGWGIDLCTGEYGDLHESLDDIDDVAVQLVAAGVADEIEHEHIGYRDCADEASILLIKRTHTQVSDYGITGVDPESLTPPTEDELAALNKALDHMGYAGPREVKLLLAACYG